VREKLEGWSEMTSVFGCQPSVDLHSAVRQDVESLKGHGVLSKDAPVSGWFYDVDTGKAGKIVQCASETVSPSQENLTGEKKDYGLISAALTYID